MNEPMSHTFQEIMSQPEVWKDVLKDFYKRTGDIRSIWHNQATKRVLLIGCGSTYYLALSAAALFQELVGVSASAHPASELLLYPERVLLPAEQPLLIAVSRSGETSETVEAVSAFRRRTAGRVVAITCFPQSSMARLADLVIDASAAQEKSVAQTRSFSSMLLLAQALVGVINGTDIGELEKLPDAVGHLLADYHTLASRVGEDISIKRFFFLGSGFLYGVACEAMLKMKEMSLSHSEAYHVLEFRHGPMSLVNSNTLVVGLLGEQAYVHEAVLLRQMRELGSRVLAVTAAAGEKDEWGEIIRLPGGLPHWVSTVLYLPVLQLLAYYRAIAKGLDPDHPTNLDAVVVLPPFNMT